MKAKKVSRKVSTVYEDAPYWGGGDPLCPAAWKKEEEFVSPEEVEAIQGLGRSISPAHDSNGVECLLQIISDLRQRVKALEEETAIDFYKPSALAIRQVKGPTIQVSDEEDRELLYGRGDRTKQAIDVAIDRARKAAKAHGGEPIKANPLPILTVKKRMETGREYSRDHRKGNSEAMLKKAMGVAYEKYLKSYEQFLSDKELQAVRNVLRRMLSDGLVIRCGLRMLKDKLLQKAIGKEDMEILSSPTRDLDDDRKPSQSQVDEAMKILTKKIAPKTPKGRKTKSQKKR